MSFNWKTVKLRDLIVSANTGLDAIKRAPIVNYNSGVKCLRIQDISQEKEMMNWGFCKVSKQNYENFQLKKNDIIIARTGATVGVNRIIKNDLKAVYNNGLIRIKTDRKKLLSKFLYYCFQSKSYKNHINAIAVGTSTQPNMRIEALLDFPVELPNIEIQTNIVFLLSVLDEKIGLNRQINQTLEAIAQAIFKHWFIDFEFPDENGEPYKSSGGEMVDSEMGLIPKGWRFEKLGNLLSEIVTGNRPKGGVSKFKEGIPSIGAESINGLCNYNFSKTKYIPELYFSNMKKGIVKNGDIFLYKDGANLGRKSMFLENFPFKKCCVNSHVFILRANSLMRQSYLYFYLDQKFMTKNIINLNTNSAQPGINSTSVKTLRILLPSGKILNLFNELVFPILKTIFNNAKENQCLSNLRDALLPKLMSGEIRVPVNSRVLIIKNN